MVWLGTPVHESSVYLPELKGASEVKQAYVASRDVVTWIYGCSESGQVLGYQSVSRSNSKHWFTTSFLQPLPYLVTPQPGYRKLSANEQFFVGAQTVVSLLQTTQTSKACHLQPPTKFTPAKIKRQSFESRRNSFLYPGWMRLMFTCVLGR